MVPPPREPEDDPLGGLLRSLWEPDPGHPLAGLLPGDAPALAAWPRRLREHLDRLPRARHGAIDPAAIVRGDVVHLGAGAVIEAGAVVHESCRLQLGAGSRVRAGAVLRDDVVIGEGCLVGAHCEVVRSVLAGPGTLLGHQVILLDSVAGARALLSGAVSVANTTLGGGPVGIRIGGRRVETGRTHLGALVGDGARIGAGVTACPGTVVRRGLAVPPGAVLMGVVDAAAAGRLHRRFLATWGDGAG